MCGDRQLKLSLDFKASNIIGIAMVRR